MKIVGKTIDGEQLGFIQGRDTMDGIMTVQKAWHTIRTKFINKKQNYYYDLRIIHSCKLSKDEL